MQSDIQKCINFIVSQKFFVGGVVHYITLWCNSSPISEKDCIKESRLKWTIVLYIIDWGKCKRFFFNSAASLNCKWKYKHKLFLNIIKFSFWNFCECWFNRKRYNYELNYRFELLMYHKKQIWILPLLNCLVWNLF